MTIIRNNTTSPEPYRMQLPPRQRLTKALRQRVFEKCGGRCGYCGEELGARWCVDYMHAHYRGGSDDFDNLMPACQPCNLRKMAEDVEVFRRELEAQVERARRSSVNFRFAERYGLVTVTNAPVVFYFERLAAQEPRP